MKDFQHDDPSNWKWGVIYFNKRDARLVVPKIIPIMGWTFNFAHPISWVMIILVISMIIFISYQY